MKHENKVRILESGRQGKNIKEFIKGLRLKSQSCNSEELRVLVKRPEHDDNLCLCVWERSRGTQKTQR